MSSRPSFLARCGLVLAVLLAGLSTCWADARASNLWWMPENASEGGVYIDQLIWFILFLTGGVFVLTQIVYIFFIVKYRARKGVRATYSHGNNRLEIIWTAIPTAIFIGLWGYSNHVWWDVLHSTPPANSLQVGVAAYQFGFSFQYPETPISTIRDLERSLVKKGIARLWDINENRVLTPQDGESTLGRRRGEGNTRATVLVFPPYKEILRAWTEDPNIGHIMVTNEKGEQHPHFFSYSTGKRLLSPKEIDVPPEGWNAASYVAWQAAQDEKKQQRREERATAPLVSQPRSATAPPEQIEPPAVAPTPIDRKYDNETLREAIELNSADKHVDDKILADALRIAENLRVALPEVVGVLRETAAACPGPRFRTPAGVVNALGPKLDAYLKHKRRKEAQLLEQAQGQARQQLNQQVQLIVDAISSGDPQRLREVKEFIPELENPEAWAKAHKDAKTRGGHHKARAGLAGDVYGDSG